MKKFVLLLLLSSVLFSQEKNEKLMLVGGGDWSQASKDTFMDWGKGGDILFIPWSNSDGGAYFRFVERFSTERPQGKGIIDGVSRAELLSENPVVANAAYDKLEAQIKNAKAVFFSGGDQDLAMDVLQRKVGDKERGKQIHELLKKRFHEEGVPMGGTSAGTAIMSPIMITVDKDDRPITKQGLGLVNEDVIVDQHFDTQKREPRLTKIWRESQATIGIGVDENSSAMILANRTCKNLGTDTVIILDKKAKPERTVLKPGESYDLVNHSRLILKEKKSKHSPETHSAGASE